MSLIEELKGFVLKGDIIELAVAVVMGLAFNAIVTAFISDIITPLIGIPGHLDFSTLSYTINGSTLMVGLFVNAIINFVTISLVVFFFLVKPVSKLKKSIAAKKAEEEKKEPTTKECPECLSKIPIKARRCAFCTAELK